MIKFLKLICLIFFIKYQLGVIIYRYMFNGILEYNFMMNIIRAFTEIHVHLLAN